jgi:retron-type reverse transcriptase
MGRVPGIKLRHFSMSAGSSSTVSTDGLGKLRKIAMLNQTNPNFIVTDKLYRILFDRGIFQIAYDKLKSKPGNMTPGILPTTLDGLSLEVIDEIINSLRKGTFKFQPGRRVQIPKANGKMRPLTIAPPRDKLVQEGMRMILEAIYEPTFLENSHGFRPGKSCHTALKMIKQRFGVAT